MKRSLLALVFFALAAPIAVAGSIDYQGTGTISGGTASTQGSIAVGKTWEVIDQLVQIDNNGVVQTGNLGKIDLTTGTLSSCAAGFCFTGGTLDIDNLSDADLALATFTSGSISTAGGVTTLSAFLPNGAATVIKLSNNSFSTQALVGTVPEPATLGLLGTGLVSLAGLVWSKRRKHDLEL